MAIYQIQIRRGTSAEWTAANPILAAGEFGLETDTRRLKIGTGAAVWSQLTYLDVGPPQAVAAGGIADLTGATTPDNDRHRCFHFGRPTVGVFRGRLQNKRIKLRGARRHHARLVGRVGQTKHVCTTSCNAHRARWRETRANIAVTPDGLISVAAPYVLPAATTSAQGGVQLADAAALTNGTSQRVVDAAQLKTALSLKADISSLATVATTGSYVDLLNPPAEFDGGNF